MKAKRARPEALRGCSHFGRPMTHLGYHTPGPVPYVARVRLREACEAWGLSVYQVAMSGYAQGTVDPATVYRLARGDTSRIDLPTLATVAGILHTLTGQPVTALDLLTLEEDGEAVARWEAGDGDTWRGR
ncbi:hypothetical protein QOL99_02955 [Deinococcus sp. MIMF12]|uniref:XRE family transcriptional regulator n=1 Tax=Deinococcus rhizophilus TaxID=3049544 RepID=A0ABT7JDG9_9DEIO|nr:hypothetical protein [Deinococcus rhizophilus]MDL2343104.1 hypothetical protein [Deinococcus rhizophilus]